MKEKSSLIELVNQLFISPNIIFSKKIPQYSKSLIKSNLIIDTDLDNFKLNTSSDLVNQIILEVAEKELALKFELDISEALKFVDSFNKFLNRGSNRNFVINTYTSIVEPFLKYVLLKLHETNDLTTFLYSLSKNRKDTQRHLYQFSDYYFKVLPFIKIELKDIFEVIVKYFNDEQKQHAVILFCQNLAINNLQLAKNFYEYGVINGLHEYGFLSSQLLAGIYNRDEKILEKGKELYKLKNIVGVNFFATIKIKNSTHINGILTFGKQIISKETNTLIQVSYLFENIFRSSLSVTNEKVECFKEWNKLFSVDDKNLKSHIMHTFAFAVEDFEMERYNFLLYALEKTGDFKIIKNYFNNYKEPKYFFDLFKELYFSSSFRIPLELFEDGMSHFWNIAQEETELQILKLISNDKMILRSGGLKLLLLSYNGIYSVDFLKTNEKEQLRIVEEIVNFPHSLDKLLPILLRLRKSEYISVVIFLIKKLSILIFESYHDYLYNLVLENIGKDKEDKNFLKPLKKSLDEYHDLFYLKRKYNDLNPIENERSWMDLYYSLEIENQAKMINDINNDDSSFLNQSSTSTDVVRGHSFKMDGKAEVIKMSKISSSYTLNADLFKNPDLFEVKLSNPKRLY